MPRPTITDDAAAPTTVDQCGPPRPATVGAQPVSGDTVPFVSVVIPVRNERRFIACCLDSVLANDYPAGRLEILVVDGMSDDGTRAVLDRYAARFPAVRVVDNPDKTTPAALNRSIRQARGEIIVRLDAHARLAPDYVAQCVAWLEKTGADNVGGVMRTLPRGGGVIAEAIAMALGHRFGVGGSAFRTHAGGPRWVDTVFGGCYRRETCERIGWFNERLPRGQDLEFNLRLKRAGGRTLLVPSIRCDYFARSKLWEFVRHNWTNGVWAVRPFLESRIVPVRPRHLAPLVFVVALGAAAVSCATPLGAWPITTLMSCYLMAATAAAVEVAWRSRDARHLFVLPLVFPCLHLAYGLGSLWGLAVVAPAVLLRRLVGAGDIQST